MIRYTINPDRTVQVTTTSTDKTLGFRERLDAQYPTPNSDLAELNEYDEHKLYK